MTSDPTERRSHQFGGPFSFSSTFKIGSSVYIPEALASNTIHVHVAGFKRLEGWRYRDLIGDHGSRVNAVQRHCSNLSWSVTHSPLCNRVHGRERYVEPASG